MIEDIIRVLNSKRMNKQDIDVDDFKMLIKKLQNEDIYDIRIGIICEEFLCHNPIVNYDIFKYVCGCYEKFNLNTENTKKVVNLIYSCYGYDGDINNFEESIVKYYLKNKDFGFEFYNNFLKVYENYGANSDIVKKCVENIIRYKYYCEQKTLDIFCEIYDETKDIKLLEEILWKSIKDNYMVHKKYFEKMKEFYLEKNIFSKKSFEIIIFMVMQLNYVDLYKLVCNMLKYEAIKYNGNSKILYYKVSEDEEWKTVKYEGEYPLVKLGYSFYYYLMSEENGNKEITKVQREYINQNMSLFLDFYNVIDDGKFKEFAALVCYEFDYFEEEILNYYLKYGEDIDEKKKIYRFILSKSDGKKMGNYILDYYKIVDNADEIMSYVYKLSELDVREATKILVILDRMESNNKFITNSTNIMDKALMIDELDLELTEFFFSVYTNINNDKIKSRIRGILVTKTYNSELVPFLYEMYKVSGDRRFGEKLIKICKKADRQYDDAIVNFVIKHLETQHQDLKDFIANRELSIVSCKVLFNIAEKYFEKDKLFSLYILKAIKNKYKEAEEVLTLINDENTIIGKYIIGEKVSTGNFAHIFRAHNLFKKEKVWAVYVRQKFEKIFKKSIEKKEIGAFKKRHSGFYIIKSVVTLREWIFREGVGKEKLLEYFIDILDMEILFMENDIIFEDISLDNILMLDEKPIPIFVYNVSKFNKSSISQNKKLVNEFSSILNEMLKSISIKKKFVVDEENCKDLKRFRDDIVLNLSKIKNNKVENIINNILDEDLAVKEAYDKIMNFEVQGRDEERISYLLRYFQIFRSPENAIKMLEMLIEREQYILNNEALVQKIIKFIKISCRNKYISFDEITQYVNSSKVFSDEQMEYLIKYIEFMRVYKMKVVTAK